MAIDSADRAKALGLFKRQIDCILRDDREAQMELYTEDLRYEFPFANDRPKLIEGRKSFLNVMTPLWEDARQKGARITGCKYDFHATDEVGLFVAVFVLEAVVAEKVLPVSFVQLIRIKDEHISEVREYFSPMSRSAIIGQH